MKTKIALKILWLTIILPWLQEVQRITEEYARKEEEEAAQQAAEEAARRDRENNKAIQASPTVSK